MLTRATLAVLMTIWLSSLAAAMSSGEMQRQWAEHGFKHGAWDCYGKCPEGRRHRH